MLDMDSSMEKLIAEGTCEPEKVSRVGLRSAPAGDSAFPLF
jgi:hypothetical protein